MSNYTVKHEVRIKQYLRSILDISGKTNIKEFRFGLEAVDKNSRSVELPVKKGCVGPIISALDSRSSGTAWPLCS